MSLKKRLERPTALVAMLPNMPSLALPSNRLPSFLAIKLAASEDRPPPANSPAPCIAILRRISGGMFSPYSAPAFIRPSKLSRLSPRPANISRMLALALLRILLPI